jgi:hypothetical protein
MGQMVQRAHQMCRNQASSLEANNPNEIWQRAQSIQPVVQRVVDPSVEMGQMVQRAHQMGRNQASGDLESRLNASKGGGSPLSENVRGFMEPRFGADFSGVRVHTGGEAVQMNQELGAQAFTHGSDVYFGEGKEPGNNELTAHELTHVVQQTGEETSTVQRHSLVSSKIPSSVNIARWAINGNTAKVNSENDRLGQLPGKFKSSASNWVCIKPLFMRTSSNPTPPTDFDTHYEKYLQLGDTFDISNLKKTYKGTSLKLSLFGDTENNNTVLSVLYPGIKTSQDPDQDIKATAQEGKTPIGDFVIGGHQSGGTMYGKSGEFNPGQFSPDEPAPTFSRAKDSKFPRRCWFTHFGTARSVGCSSESFGQSFASVYLRQGSGIDTTTRPIAPACTSDFKRPEGGCESIDAIEFRPANDEVKTSDHGPFKLSNSDAFHQSPFWSRIAGNL